MKLSSVYGSKHETKKWCVMNAMACAASGMCRSGTSNVGQLGYMTACGVLCTNEGQPTNKTKYDHIACNSLTFTLAKVVWSVCTTGVYNVAIVQEDASAT